LTLRPLWSTLFPYTTLFRSCADAVLGLLRSGEGVRILATSRHPLGLAGEVKLRVPSLSMPKSTATLDEVGRYEASQLFIDRAARSEEHTSELQSLAYLVCRL